MTESPHTRKVFCNRTLNLKALKAIGYDMDYTLVHYNVEHWEKRVYDYLKEHFLALGWPVSKLQFNENMVCRGLVIDTETGNLVKTNRFGFVKKALHGTVQLDFAAQRNVYSRIIVDLAESRWVFLNTLFSLSEGCMYAQLVDLLDQKLIPETLGYKELYWKVRRATDTVHAVGKLKAEIISAPDQYVVREPETALTLLDQFYAGKKLMMITNSDWHYANFMMSYAFDSFLPNGLKWRDLFSVVVISARKPEFFTTQKELFEVVTSDGLLRPSTGDIMPNTVYFGGSARQIEQHLGLSGDEILYIGDHMYGDVQVTKNVLRWRTGLILRELETDIEAEESFFSKNARLTSLMREKEQVEAEIWEYRIELQRVEHKYGPAPLVPVEQLQSKIQEKRLSLEKLDHALAPLARTSGEHNNPIWGLLMRAGNDKSLLAYQMERHADVYTSRVSNFLAATPYVYLRSPRGALPHDIESIDQPKEESSGSANV